MPVPESAARFALVRFSDGVPLRRATGADVRDLIPYTLYREPPPRTNL